MTTVSEEVQNGVDVNTDKEDMYNYIPDEFDEYSYAYMDVKGQVDIQMTSESKRSGKAGRHDTQTGKQASGEYYERVGNESGDGQHAYTALILEDVEGGNHEGNSQIYTQLKQGNESSKQGKVAKSEETNADAQNQFYVNNKVVENMKRVKRF